MTHKRLCREMDFAEFISWQAYEHVHGLPDIRTEAATALAGSAVCRTWGSKIKPADLIPDFNPPKTLSYKEGAAIFAAFAEGHNKRTNKQKAT